MAVTVGGADVIGATLCEPRVGFWHMDAVLDSAAQLSGQVKVDLGPRTLMGTVLEGGPYTETGYYRVVGGGGGLAGSKACAARAFGQTSLRTPLLALLKDVGEQLDASADAGVLGTALAGWTTLGVAAGRQLRALVQAAPAGTAYRFASGGGLWLGPEAWPDAGIAYEELSRLPSEGRVLITTEEATLTPGTVLDGLKVGYVEHRFDPNKLRTTFLVEVDA